MYGVGVGYGTILISKFKNVVKNEKQYSNNCPFAYNILYEVSCPRMVISVTLTSDSRSLCSNSALTVWHASEMADHAWL